jgi:hypothetical protein
MKNLSCFTMLEDKILSGRCVDVPSAASKLNPCRSWRMILNISNTGRKYSGDNTVIPYTLYLLTATLHMM